MEYALFIAELFFVFFVAYYAIALPWRLVRFLRVLRWKRQRDHFEIEWETDVDEIMAPGLKARQAARPVFFGNVTTYLNHNPAFPARVIVSSQVALQEFFEAVKQMVRA